MATLTIVSIQSTAVAAPLRVLVNVVVVMLISFESKWIVYT
jgi:hypothetical protein